MLFHSILSPLFFVLSSRTTLEVRPNHKQGYRCCRERLDRPSEQRERTEVRNESYLHETIRMIILAIIHPEWCICIGNPGDAILNMTSTLTKGRCMTKRNRTTGAGSERLYALYAKNMLVFSPYILCLRSRMKTELFRKKATTICGDTGEYHISGHRLVGNFRDEKWNGS